MLPSPYADAADLVRALDAREVSAVELAEAAIGRIEALDGAINAICVKTFDRARRDAVAADARRARGERGALLGVPLTVKESFDVEGTPSTWGFPFARDNIAKTDALAVRRAAQAGAVLLGKTNVPLALADWQSYNDIYGVSRNPYDLARTPGGSSGGSSAALAAGFGALSMGSDIGGSLRVPAHFCGVFAHKPTHDLCPPRGQTPPGLPELPGSVDLAVIGPMARSARDLASLLDVMAGPDELDMGVGYRLALPPARGERLGDFRVLLLDRHPLVETEACVAQALETLAGNLEKAGATVARRSDLLPDLDESARLYIHLLLAVFSAGWPQELYDEVAARAAEIAPDDRSFLAERARGATLTQRAWAAANYRRRLLRQQWRALFGAFDAVIAPVTPTPPFPHDHSPDQDARTFLVNGEPVEYFANVLWPGVATLPGLPATALPIGRSPEGLPIGAQIIGPWLEDRTPLRLAQCIEEAFGGFSPPPLG